MKRRAATAPAGADDPGNAECSQCRTKKAFRPTMLLYKPPCDHLLCDACLAKLFGNQAGSAQCPMCRTLIDKRLYMLHDFIDLHVDKQLRERAQYARIFNLIRDDFSSDDAYNEYLENAEDLMYTLSSAPDTKTKQSALANLEAFKRKHAETIAKNRALMEQWERQVRDSIAKQADEARSKLELLRDRERREKEQEELRAKSIQEALARGETVDVDDEIERENAAKAQRIAKPAGRPAGAATGRAGATATGAHARAAAATTSRVHIAMTTNQPRFVSGADGAGQTDSTAAPPSRIQMRAGGFSDAFTKAMYRRAAFQRVAGGE